MQRRRELALDRGRGALYRDGGKHLVVRAVLTIIDEQEKLISRHNVAMASHVTRVLDNIRSFWRTR